MEADDMTAPYYSDESVTLYHGRWEQLIPESFTADLIIADPPYGETSLSWDTWPEGWPTLAARHASSMWCFGSMRMFLDLAGSRVGEAQRLEPGRRPLLASP